MTGYLTPPDPDNRENLREAKEQESIERAERKREEQKPFYVSDCCSVHIPFTEYGFCPACQEHCNIIDLNNEN